MKKELIKIVIDHIQKIWKNNNPENAKMGIWFALYNPIFKADKDFPESPVLDTWFITNHNIEIKKSIRLCCFYETRT